MALAALMYILGPSITYMSLICRLIDSIPLKALYFKGGRGWAWEIGDREWEQSITDLYFLVKSSYLVGIYCDYHLSP